MHIMLRALGLNFLLLASGGPASAMDPSAMEETNCLMACDANQQNCAASHSRAVRGLRSSSLVGVRQTAGILPMSARALPQPKQHSFWGEPQ
jgi:hypothetical protein